MVTDLTQHFRRLTKFLIFLRLNFYTTITEIFSVHIVLIVA